jgi:iron complex outermembrane receptor protein
MVEPGCDRIFKKKGKWNTNLGYKTVSDHYLFNSMSLPNDNKSNVIQALSSADFSLSEKKQVSQLACNYQQGITSNDRGDHRYGKAPPLYYFTRHLENIFLLTPLQV